MDNIIIRQFELGSMGNFNYFIGDALSHKIAVVDPCDKTGFLLNLAGIIVVTLVTYFWGTLVFGIDVNSFPDWAVTITPGK